MTDPLVFAHIGDLHIESAFETNTRDMNAIALALGKLQGQIDFVVLPGDIANNGQIDEYKLVNAALRKLGKMPVHAISGDHDMTRGTLDNFYRRLRLPGNVAPPPLPHAAVYKGVTCVFLDMCRAGKGQGDFRLDPHAGRSAVPPVHRQLDVLAEQVEAAPLCVVFMHTYPADLVDPLEQAAVVKILSAPQVRLVDIGHTHYNEIANDGQKIYAATRSTGQIQEGEVGYSIATLDEGIVSWRFRLLAATGPIVLITSPVDRRLAGAGATVATGRGPTTCDLRASILSTTSVTACTYSIDGAPPLPMTGRGSQFGAALALGGSERFVTVTATDGTGTGVETIQLTRPQDLTLHRHADGSDADRIGRWSERGILATQLGPNRNGRKW